MNPLSFLQFATFAALMGLFVPLSALARECVAGDFAFPQTRLDAPAYFLYLLIIILASVIRAVVNVFPRSGSWIWTRSLLVHVSATALLTAAGATWIALFIGPDVLRLALVALPIACGIHTVSLTLGITSPWAPGDPESVRVPLIIAAANANRFLFALLLIVLAFHVLMNAGDVVHTIDALMSHVRQQFAQS